MGWLRKNPKSFGFANELWTARRLASVIERKLGVRYNHRYLNAWLTARDITPQKPQKKARERDEPKIQRWRKNRWRSIQNGRAA